MPVCVFAGQRRRIVFAVFFDGDRVLFSELLPLGRETNSVADNRAAKLLSRGLLRVEADLVPSEDIGVYGDTTNSARNLDGEVAVATRHDNRISASAARGGHRNQHPTSQVNICPSAFRSSVESLHFYLLARRFAGPALSAAQVSC